MAASGIGPTDVGVPGPAASKRILPDQLLALVANVFSIGTPTMLPHSVQLPS